VLRIVICVVEGSELQPNTGRGKVSTIMTKSISVNKVLQQEYFHLWSPEGENESSYLGIVFSKLNKVIGPDIPGVKTAAVGWNPRSKDIDLFINTTYVQKLIDCMIVRQKDNYFVRTLLKHEILHVICQHVFEFRDNNDDAQTKNIAMDLVVNQFSLPANVEKDYKKNGPEIDQYVYENWWYPGRSTNQGDELDKLVTSFPPGLSWREYYDAIKASGITIPPSGNVGTDEHLFSKLDPEEEQVLRQKINFILKESAKQLIQFTGVNELKFGNLPSEILEYLQNILQLPKQNWKALLKHFVTSAQSVDREGTVHRTNRRMPGVLPGSRRKQTASIVVFVDQSGSMSDEDIQKVIPEINSMGEHVKKIDVFNFDTELDEASHMVWEKNKPKEWKRTRSGGTNFDCIAEFLFKNQNRWTGAIVYTDGFAAPMKHLNLKAKVMYLITHGGNIDQTTIKHTDHVVKM